MVDRECRMLVMLVILVLTLAPPPVRGIDIGGLVKVTTISARQLTDYLQRLFNATALPLVRRFERPTENPLAEWI
ncbi:hypothetical protein ZHAS_00003790 [Anopheles sinensis]|uniref:Uncharacterized protein n=1 Tax=Anopheles sinensis TaxID=74873 RepID=A0A084VF50_ANOSI|nr:hypothetical protein ZHAS_00003790 [Anopheles sinensis]